MGAALNGSQLKKTDRNNHPSITKKGTEKWRENCGSYLILPREGVINLRTADLPTPPQIAIAPLLRFTHFHP